MIISTFFNSYAGMYVAQSFCHSLIAAIITERAVKAWKVDDPAAQQRFHLIAVIFPIFSFPLYQALNANRSSAQFRLDALFDINRWLNWEIWGAVPLGLLFLVMLIATSLVFLFQESIPVVKHTLESRNAEHDGTACAPEPFVEKASRDLSLDAPEVLILDDDEPVLFSTTGRDPVIFISAGLREALTEDQLHAALAHELAHIARSRRPLLITVFVLRAIMFFNPAVLVKFRRAVRDEEKICDDIAVSLTGNPKALAGALEKFYHKPAAPVETDGRKLPAVPLPIEEYSHNLHLESRISRLEHGAARTRKNETALFAITLLVITVLNYFVV
ncbi:MAG TPA: M56 family metallopeptidase [Nitrospirota bacterium]|nr:M56 family metallopeptidase [Nitrospirota bacterium]